MNSQRPKTTTNRAKSIEGYRTINKSNAFKPIQFDLNSTPILTKDFNQPLITQESIDFNQPILLTNSKNQSQEHLSWLKQSQKSAQRVNSGHKTSRRDSLLDFSDIKKQDNQNIERVSSSQQRNSQSRAFGVSVEGFNNFKQRVSASFNQSFYSASKRNSVQIDSPNIKIIIDQNPRNDQQIQTYQPLLKHYSRKQQNVLRDLSKRYSKPQVVESLSLFQTPTEKQVPDNVSQISNNRKVTTPAANKSLQVSPQKVSLSQLKMPETRSQSYSRRNSPLRLYSAQGSRNRSNNQSQIKFNEEENQYNPFSQTRTSNQNKTAASRFQSAEKNQSVELKHSESTQLFPEENIPGSTASNPNSHRTIHQNQAALMRMNFQKMIASRRAQKEELDKDIVRKISERVEKLLKERDDMNINNGNEKEEKPNGTTNINTSNTVVDRQDESVLPELNYNQHLRPIFDIEDNKSVSDSAQASFLKGIGRMKNYKDKSAISAFKQSLNFDKMHFASIYNLACLYERNKCLKKAEMWLDIAVLFKKNTSDVNYGHGVIYYKSHRFEDAYKKIDSLIIELERAKAEEERKKRNGNDDGDSQLNGDDDKEENEEEEEEEDEDEQMLLKQTHLYLRSLCAKQLGQKASERPDDKANQALLDEQSRPATASSKMKMLEFRPYSTFNNFFEEKKETPLYIAPTSQQYYKKASDDYKAFIQYTCPKNFNLFKHFMFAIVFKKIRKMEIKFPPHIFCEFYSLVNQILAAETYTPALEPIIQSEQQAINKGEIDPIVKRPSTAGKQSQRNQLIAPGQGLGLSLLTRRKADIVKRIQGLSFFKRFNQSIISDFIPQLELRYADKSELLFAKKSEVFIITGGYLTVFDHSKQFNEPDIVAYYTEGDIIGCDDKDNRISFNPDIWFLSITKVEYVAIDEQAFSELWNLQYQHSNKSILTFIRQIDIFERVSQLTLFRLAFELFYEKIFQNSEIVYNDGESISKYNYIELHKEDPKALRNLRNRINNKIEILPHTQQAIQGFYLIQEGNLKLQTHNDWQNYTLKRYNFIGENLLFPSLSISRFGQIVCSTPTSKCLFFSRYEFHKLSSLDKEVMKQNVLKSQYYANCQKILYKYYKYHKIEDFDQQKIHNG